MTQSSPRSSPYLSVLFALMAFSLAALVWFYLVTPAQGVLTRQIEKRDTLKAAVREAEHERRRLQRLNHALNDDAATIERALREQGFTKEHDRTLVEPVERISPRK